MFRKLTLSILAVLMISALGINASFAQDVENVGEVLLISGHVLDVNGNPVEGAVVEIWQTDANGTYNHPNDPNVANITDDFQYFGSSATDSDGLYSFRTIKPALYEASRPPHIHVKVKLDGEELLTTQFYFAEDSDLATFSQSAPDLVLSSEPIEDENGETVLEASKDLIVTTLDSGSSGSMTLTTAQTEGPYYPVVDISEYDNDLTDASPAMTESAPFTLLNLNTSSSDDFLTIPDMSNRMVREFEEYRPYISIVQFRREIGKYVDDAQVATYEAYVYVPIDVDESDAETLKQIPGVDDDIAASLMEARPFGSNDAFLAALADYLPEADVNFAANYLAGE